MLHTQITFPDYFTPFTLPTPVKCAMNMSYSCIRYSCDSLASSLKLSSFPHSRTPFKLFMRIFIFVFTSIHLPSTSVQRLSSQSSIVSISVSVCYSFFVSLANCRSVWGQLANYVNTHTLTHTDEHTRWWYLHSNSNSNRAQCAQSACCTVGTRECSHSNMHSNSTQRMCKYSIFGCRQTASMPQLVTAFLNAFPSLQAVEGERERERGLSSSQFVFTVDTQIKLVFT